MPRHPLTTRPAQPATNNIIVICYGCAGSKTDPKGGPCRRCNGTGIDPNP